MSEENKLYLDDVADWLSPSQAVALLRPTLPLDEAVHKLVLRLRAGKIRAYAGTLVTDLPREATDNVIIEPEVWTSNTVYEGSFWRSGDLTITHHDHRIGYSSEHQYLDVKLERKAVLGLLPKMVKEPASAPEEVKSQERGAPVAQAHLEAWFKVYQQAYQGSEDTEATAIRSAEGMFPGKHVSRQKIRDLRGARKRGRPTKTAN